MSRTPIATLMLATVMLAASGCGGSSKSSSQAALSTQTASPTQAESPASNAPLSRAELITKADAICKGVNAKRATVHLRTNQDFVRTLPQVAAYERSEIAELSKLTPPSSMATDWREILAGNRMIAENTAKVAEYTKANNISGAHTLLVSATQAQDQLTATAQRDGFKACARLR
jgi:hypothetical protein